MRARFDRMSASARRQVQAAQATIRAYGELTFRIVRSWRRMSPPALLLWSFAALIAVGVVGLLFLPALYTGDRLGVLDAIFTATSAVCVTGLIVVDTATHFTMWGQLWILLLIQLGGIGLITITTAIIGALGGRISIRAELTGVPGGARTDQSAIWELAKQVAVFTLIVEGAGMAVLFVAWLPRFPVDEALWHALFQSVSAFCNAGFSTFTTSLEGFDTSLVTVFAITSLIIVGGIGYPCLRELTFWWRTGRRGARRRHLSVHTYSVLLTTAVLLLIGTILYAVFEWDHTLAEYPLHHKLSNAYFSSVTARTAGFNTIPYGEIGSDAGFLTILLMLIGGAPGSTAGGLKTTTAAVLVALAWSRVRGQRVAEIRHRGVPDETLERSVSLVLLALLVIGSGFFWLNAFTPDAGAKAEQAQFLPMSFEVVSAFCTVGLSMGTTATLSAGGKVVIIVLMFIGRVGLFSFFSALLLRRARGPFYRPALEDLQVG